MKLPDKKLVAIFENNILHNMTFLRDMFATLGLTNLAQKQGEIYTIFLMEIENRRENNKKEPT